MRNLFFPSLAPAGLGFSPDPQCSVCPGMVLSFVERGGSLSVLTQVLQFGKIVFFFSFCSLPDSCFFLSFSHVLSFLPDLGKFLNFIFETFH